MSDDPVLNTKLVEIVEKYPCIYDFTRKDHSRREVIEKAWKAIEAEVKLPAVQCKEKWKNLRTAFSRSMKAPRSGSGATKKTYYLKDAMQFVLPFMKAKPQSGNLPCVEEMTEILNDNSNETSEPEVPRLDDSTQFQSDDPSVDKIENVQKLVSLETKKTTEIPNKNSRKRTSIETNEADKCFIEYVNWKRAKTTMSENSNPTLEFLRSLLPDLEKMNDYQIRQFKKRTLDTIDSILCDAPPNFPFVTVPTPSPALSSFSYQSYTSNSLSDQEMRPKETNTQINQRPLESYLQNFTAQLPNDITT